MIFEIIMRDDGVLYQRIYSDGDSQNDAPKGFGNKGVKILVQIKYPGNYFKGLSLMEISPYVSAKLIEALESSKKSSRETFKLTLGEEVEVDFTMSLGVTRKEVEFYLSCFCERINKLEKYDNRSD